MVNCTIATSAAFSSKTTTPYLICLSDSTFHGGCFDRPHRKKRIALLLLVKNNKQRLFTNKTINSSMDRQQPLMLTSGASGRISALFSLRALKSFLAIINAVLLFLLVPFRGRRRTVVVGNSSGDQKLSSIKDEDIGRKGGGPMVRVPAKIVPWKKGGFSSSSSISSSGSGAGGVVAVVDPEVAARRAIAIKKVLEDSNDPNIIREFFLFVNDRDETLFVQSWTPASCQIRAVMVVMHGLNEHSGRYGDFAKLLNKFGFKVYGMDWIGHGGSDGLHAYVHALDDAVSDLKSLLDKITAENPGLPCFCFGHSTGGAIILKAALDPKVESQIEGIVLTSPAVGVQPSHPIFAVLAPIVAYLLPRYQLSAANKKGVAVSRDPQALVVKYTDPLVYTGAIRVRTGNELLRITTYLQQNLHKLRVPFLVLHGTADTVTDPEASQKLYEEASSRDKTIKLYEGFLHDLLFEPEKEEILQEIVDWLKNRVM